MYARLLELLTRKNINNDVITNRDINTHKRILVLTNANFFIYEPGGAIKSTRRAKYRKVISRLFPPTRRAGTLRHYRSTLHGGAK